ncbi:MAG: hypothetical protein ACSLFP_04710 [Acidimicrobiales bacterium]
MAVDREEQGAVVVTVTGWVDVDADPPVALAELVDAAGDVWELPVPGPLVADDLHPGVGLPRAGAVACTIVRDEMVAGILIVHIDTARPDGIASVDGVSRFRVLRASVP